VKAWEPPTIAAAASDSSAEAERIARLEGELAGLRAEVDDLKQQFADFRRQFE
jgi:uncharacterized protein